VLVRYRRAQRRRCNVSTDGAAMLVTVGSIEGRAVSNFSEVHAKFYSDAKEPRFAALQGHERSLDLSINTLNSLYNYLILFLLQNYKRTSNDRCKVVLSGIRAAFRIRIALDTARSHPSCFGWYLPSSPAEGEHAVSLRDTVGPCRVATTGRSPINEGPTTRPPLVPHDAPPPRGRTSRGPPDGFAATSLRHSPPNECPCAATASDTPCLPTPTFAHVGFARMNAHAHWALGWASTHGTLEMSSESVSCLLPLFD